MFHGVIAEDADFEAAAAQVHDAAGHSLGPERREHGFPAQAGFFRRADDLQHDSRFSFYRAHEGVAVFGFASGAGSHSAIARHTEVVHHFAKIPECFNGFFEDVFTETRPQKDVFSEAKRVAFRLQGFNVQCGICTRHGEAHGIGAGVDGGDVDRFRYRHR